MESKSSHQEVKDAANALVAVLQEVSLKANSGLGVGIGEQIVESIQRTNEVVKEISDASNRIFDVKMVNVDQNLMSIRDEIKLCSNTTREAISKLTVHIQGLNQNIVGLHSGMTHSIHDSNQLMQQEMSRILHELRSQEKQRKLEFQISCADINSFKYYDGVQTGLIDSTYFVRSILKAFALGLSFKFPGNLSTRNDRSSPSFEDGKKEFRAKLKDQLGTILGRAPQIVEVNNEWWVHMSEAYPVGRYH